MRIDRRWFVFVACNALLLALTAMVNDGLARWSLSLFLAGPCLVGAALRLHPAGLLLTAVASGLIGDAQLPTPPGFLTTLFVTGAGLVLAVRPWLGRAGLFQQLALAWVLNAAYFAAFTLWAVKDGGAVGWSFWERAAADFCLSQIIVLPVSSWFLDFQENMIELAGGSAEPEPVGENP